MSDNVKIRSEEETLHEKFYAEGFDILHPFQPEWYNELISRENLTSQLCFLPSFSKNRRKCHKAYLVGNTKHLWPYFLSWLSSYVKESSLKGINDNGKQEEMESINNNMLLLPPGRNDEIVRAKMPKHPLDTFTKEIIQKIISQHSSKNLLEYELFWADDYDNPDRLVCMQRVASVSGLCYFDTHSMLSVHPMYGAWLAYRAVIIVSWQGDLASSAIPLPSPIPCLLSQNEDVAIQVSMNEALSRLKGKDLCSILRRGNSCKTKNSSTGDGANENDDVYKYWINVRDCIQVGKILNRYSNLQLVYHYTKDLNILVKALMESENNVGSN